MTKSVLAIVAKAISPETTIPASFVSSDTATQSTVIGLTPSTSSITSPTVTPEPSSSSDLNVSDTSLPVHSSANSTQVRSWLSSVTPIPPSDSETSDSISNQINPPPRAYSNTLSPSPTCSISGCNEFLSSEEVKGILCQSSSRRNFATNLSRKLFDERTRLVSNVSGRNKKQLNPAIINYIRSITFKYYPCLPSETEYEQWSQCVISIDEASRRLKNKPKKN